MKAFRAWCERWDAHIYTVIATVNGMAVLAAPSALDVWYNMLFTVWFTFSAGWAWCVREDPVTLMEVRFRLPDVRTEAEVLAEWQEKVREGKCSVNDVRRAYGLSEVPDEQP